MFFFIIPTQAVYHVLKLKANVKMIPRNLTEMDSNGKITICFWKIGYYRQNLFIGREDGQ